MKGEGEINYGITEGPLFTIYFLKGVTSCGSFNFDVPDVCCILSEVYFCAYILYICTSVILGDPHIEIPFCMCNSLLV